MQVPFQLKNLPRWVCWRYGQTGKMPICCATGRPANTSDPSTWTDFETALDYSEANGLNGIGFVFASEDCLCGVDLDNCRDPSTGVLEAWAVNVVNLLDSYTEVSPSGRGVKVFLLASTSEKSWRNEKVEVHGTGRYYTVTGMHLQGTPDSVQERTEQLQRLTEREMDDELIRRGLRASNGPKLYDLLAGITTGYPSKSEADLALCGILVGLTKDPATVERLFGRSELSKRKKWRSRPDYRGRTIAKAIEGTLSLQQGLLRTKEEEYTGKNAEIDVLLKAQSIGLALDIAKTTSEAQSSKTMFILARQIQRLAGRGRGHCAESFEEAVVAYCNSKGLTKEDTENHIYVFLDCWPRVKLQEGEDPTDWAYRMALEIPVVRALSSRTPTYGIVGSVAYYLADLRKPEFFWFNVERLSKLLSKSLKGIYDVIHLLEQRGVIQCVDTHYNPVKHIARKYRFRGEIARKAG